MSALLRDLWTNFVPTLLSAMVSAGNWAALAPSAIASSSSVMASPTRASRGACT